MTFLNPLLLFGLVASAIPVLLHLFNLRRLKKIDFSTLTFLKELQKTRIRRLKLRQLLLLFLRTMLIILIVCAFARPTLRSSVVADPNERAKTTAVLVIDNSYTMTSVDQDGQLLKQAISKARKILDLMKDGDEVFLIPMSDIGMAPQDISESPLRDLNVVRSRLAAIGPSYVHRTIEEALRFTAKLLSTSKNLNKEVYVFSDFKMGNLRLGRGQGRMEDSLPSHARIFLLPVGVKPRQNLGIASVKIESALLGVGKPLSLSVDVANWGTQDVKNTVVSVFLDGTRVAQQALDVQSQNSARVLFSVTPKSAGYIRGMVELPDDDLDFDNRRSFVVNIPQILRILLVGSPEDLHYISTALSLQPAEEASVVQLKTVTSDRLSSNDIEAADGVVIANVRTLSSVQIEEVRRFVEAGGGLIWFPGSKIDSASYYSTWTRSLGIPALSAVVRLQSKPGQESSTLSFDKVDYRHPIFEGMFEQSLLNNASLRTPQQNRQTSIESPSIQTYARFLLNTRSGPIITLSDGTPFMFEQRIQKGIVLVFGVSATSDWSDFPLKGLFVPLLYRSVTFVAQQQSLPTVVPVGEQALLNLHDGGKSSVVVQNPEKVDIVTPSSSSGRETIVRFAQTTTPGIYSVRSEDKILEQFTAVLDPAESNTVRASENSIGTMFSQLGVPADSVQSIAQEANAQEIIMQSRIGLELWKYFVAAALILGLIESIVARTAKGEAT